ncbi:MAG: CoA-binding protein [Desulfovibrio sp.]|jgi:predicted CoA-binding protein|nr:CoA-binding protein [Desulfovibrio sp.]
MEENSLKRILERARVIAVVGANDRPGRPVDGVGRYLLEAGYTVIPVHPNRRVVWGLPACPSLSVLEGPVDIVDVFRAPEYCLAHARECAGLAVKPALFWMQAGISSPEAAALLAEHNIAVVEDACLMVEHERLLGGRNRTP